jgi:hypothetical protein
MREAFVDIRFQAKSLTVIEQAIVTVTNIF